MKTRMIRCACSCDAGYVARTTRVHLSRWGAPICPACMQSMVADWEGAAEAKDALDVFADLGRITAIDDVQPLEALENRYVTIRAQRACMDCGRQHDHGDCMQYNVGRNGRALVRGWFCASGCEQPVERDAPGGEPRTFRLTREHFTGRLGFSAIGGFGEGHGTGARS